jgi:hypothetical protein
VLIGEPGHHFKRKPLNDVKMDVDEGYSTAATNKTLNEDWQPIVGLDNSMWTYDPVKQKNSLRVPGSHHADNNLSKQHTGRDSVQNEYHSGVLYYHKDFDVKKNNELASQQLRSIFRSTSTQGI